MRRGNSERGGKPQKDRGRNDPDTRQGQDRSAGKGSSSQSSSETGGTKCRICKEAGHKWNKCSKRVCSICRETGHDPDTCPKIVEEDANLAISEGDQLAPGDQLGGICEYANSEYILDAFFSVSTGECDVDSGISKGLDCESQPPVIAAVHRITPHLFWYEKWC